VVKRGRLVEVVSGGLYAPARRRRCCAQSRLSANPELRAPLTSGARPAMEVTLSLGPAVDNLGNHRPRPAQVLQTTIEALEHRQAGSRCSPETLDNSGSCNADDRGWASSSGAVRVQGISCFRPERAVDRGRAALHNHLANGYLRRSRNVVVEVDAMPGGYA
jgi:hypothetical protein